MMFRKPLVERVVASLVTPRLILSTAPVHVFAQATAAVATPEEWPREFQCGSITFTVYQPQIGGGGGRFGGRR